MSKQAMFNIGVIALLTTQVLSHDVVADLANRAKNSFSPNDLEHTTIGKTGNLGVSSVARQGAGVSQALRGPIQWQGRHYSGSAGWSGRANSGARKMPVMDTIEKTSVPGSKLGWTPSGVATRRVEIAVDDGPKIKLWPAGVFVANMLTEVPASTLSGKSVLELGAGTGLPSMVAAARGAKVTASDTWPVELKADLDVLKELNDKQSLNVETKNFDFTSDEALPAADVVIFADTIRDKYIAEDIARRVDEARRRGSWVIVAQTNSGKRVPFLKALHKKMELPVHLTLDQKPSFDDVPVPSLKQIGWNKNNGRMGVLQFNKPDGVA